MPDRHLNQSLPRFAVAVLLGGVANAVFAQDNADLAKKLSNPVAALISVPFQFNYDNDIGPGDHGSRAQLNIQPVVPFTLNDDWTLISRTILPLVVQKDIAPGAGSQSGIGDIVQSFFFSPKPSDSGLTWGAGPVLLLPTGSDPLLSGRKWGAGPTVVVLKQEHGWTVGGLANHMWSYAGDGARQEINATFLQPFVSYTTPSATTFGANVESTFDWKHEQWSVPVNLTVSQVLKVGDQLLSVGGGVRYWAQGPDNGPKGWGLRLVVTLLFPR